MPVLQLEFIPKTIMSIGAFSAFIAVGAGAVGAHFLKEKISHEMLGVFEVGVRYHLFHSLSLMIIALTMAFVASGYMSLSAWLILSGMIIFSGSLYMLALTGIKLWGAVTPIGGTLLLAGWLTFLAGIIKS